MSAFTKVLTAWQFTPEITLGLALIAWVYLQGLRRRSGAPQRRGRRNWRPHCFFTGLLCLYAALQSRHKRNWNAELCNCHPAPAGRV